MKIAGLEQSLLRVRDFQLRTDPPLIVRLTALPLAFMERLRMKMPAPIQPQQTITQMGGKTTLVPDESDSPAAMRWRKEDHEDDIAVTAAIVHEALRGDQSITRLTIVVAQVWCGHQTSVISVSWPERP